MSLKLTNTLKLGKSLIILILCCISIYEYILGFLQITGLLPYGHTNFAMTGTFENPGPYGGLMAILLAILAAYTYQNITVKTKYGKIVIAISLLSCLACFSALLASYSRAAWLAFGISILFFGFCELNPWRWIKGHKLTCITASITAVLLMIGIFLMKKDSAIGRFHIWHIELRAIMEKPWTGYGRNRVLGVYGETQADFFSQKTRNDYITRIAGCPEYAFNEYFKVGIEFGIIAMFGMILFLSLIVALLLRQHSPFAYGLITFSIFAFFSYPLSAIRIKSDAEKEWESNRYLISMGLYQDAIEKFKPLFNAQKENYRYLYDLGYSLHKIGQYLESNEILMLGSKISSDPMFHNIMGKNLEATGNYDGAENEYLTSHLMVPGRIYPLYLLMKMKIVLDDTYATIIIGEKIKKMYVNERVPSMRQMKNECMAMLDSLKTNLNYTEKAILSSTNN